MFQANLCENLSHDSQVKIKCFLENCFESTDELNHSYLKTVIEGEAIAQEQTTKVKDTISVKTPMKDFFDSPRQTNKLKRDLKRLETENETLLIEKLEIEDELRIEKEKKQRIEDALLQKTEQVLKLREELQDFIQTSNSKAEEDDISSQSVSAIRSELRDLEKYVADLQDEKTALCDEKEKLMEKISTLQSKNKDFELQTVYAETKQQELLAVLRERDEEVSTLKERCMELEEKINALPSALNMSIESDTSLPLRTVYSPFGGERLSHAVVDVKLAEVEEENEKFKNQVKMLTDQRDILTSQLKELREELDKEKKQGNYSRIQIELMRIDMEGLQETCTSKEEALLELRDLSTEQTNQIHMMNSVIETGVSEKEQFKSNILSLNDHIQVLEETKEEILKENLQHKLQLSEHENTISDFKLQFEECQNILRNMAKEIENKSNIVEKLSLEIEDYKEQLKTVNEERDYIKETVCKIENDNHKLKETLIIKENLIASLRDSDTQKEEVVQVLKKQVNEQINAIHSMEIAQKKAEAEKEQLEEEVERINNLILEKERFAEKTKQDMDSKLNIIMGEMESLKESYSLKEKTLKDLKNLLKERDMMMQSLQSIQADSEAKRNDLEKKVETLNDQIQASQTLAEVRMLEMNELRENLETMKKDLDYVSESKSLKEKSLQEVETKLREKDDLIQSLDQGREAVVTEKKLLELNTLHLEDTVKNLEETKEEIMKENSHYKSQILDCVRKISDLETKVEEQESKLINFTDEISTKNNLVDRMEANVKDCYDEIETMKRERSSLEETISVKEKVNEELEQRISNMEGSIDSLEANKKGLMVEEKKLLCQVDEQKTAIKVLQQKLDSLSEEKIELEEKLLWWKAQSEAFQKMLEETKIQGSVNKVELVNDEDAVKNKIVSNRFENEFEIATLSENATSATVSSNLKDLMVQTSCDNKDKNSNLDGVHEIFSLEYVGCLLGRTVDEEKLKQLDADKLMKLVNSWHDIDATLEKLRLIECQLKAKICSLWESIPRIQSKLKEKSNCADSSKMAIEESDQAKEVIMRIISMVRSLEKHNSSLEKELVHAASNAVSWGLQGIQNQFNVVTSTPNSDHSNSDLNFKGEQKDEFCSFLDTLRDKVSQVLEDVNSSVEIFKEVEHRSANVAEALEYLKKNCLYEKEMLSDVDYEGFHIALTGEETKERFIKAMDEMERAKEDLERIACESRKEVENLQNEKENLELELQSMAARCSLLESKLEMSGKHIELAVQETQQRIQKIYEKKLEATKEKWKTMYMDDLKAYEEQCKLRKQFEESFKKYRNLAEDYEKKLAEATALNTDLKSKVQNLQGQKSCLEMKLRESRAKTFMEDEHRDSLDSGVYKSNYVDAMANYFARNNTSSPSSSMFDSQGDAHRDSISRSFSRESVQSSLPSGQVFCAEDEEGELFNATYLNDLSEGKCIVSSNRGTRAETSCGVLRESNRQSVRNPSEDTPNRRIKELMRRNTLCPPHLKSSYPTETQCHDPKNFPEDLLKGSEQGCEQGKIPSTPGRFRTWFARGKRTVPNGDAENIPFTPRTKQKGLFQRAMANLERDGS